MVRTKTHLAALERHAEEIRALHAAFAAEREGLLDRIMVLADKPMPVDFGESAPVEIDHSFVIDGYDFDFGVKADD